jgi:hypothetical protein
MRILAFPMFFAALALAGPASARLITFDSLHGSDEKIPDGWGGLHWSTDFYYLNGASEPGSGYDNGVVSPPNVAINAYGATVSFGRRAPFELVGFDLTAAWRDGLNVKVTGKLNGVKVDVETLTVNASGPTLETFDWEVNQVVFYAYGGASAHLGSRGTEFALDNLTVGPVPEASTVLGSPSAVPEPSTWAMTLLGFAGFGYAGYRKARRGRSAIPAA